LDEEAKEFFNTLRAGKMKENIKKLKEMINSNPHLLKKKDIHGLTALHWVAKRNYNEKFV